VNGHRLVLHCHDYRTPGGITAPEIQSALRSKREHERRDDDGENGGAVLVGEPDEGIPGVRAKVGGGPGFPVHARAHVVEVVRLGGECGFRDAGGEGGGELLDDIALQAAGGVEGGGGEGGRVGRGKGNSAGEGDVNEG